MYTLCTKTNRDGSRDLDEQSLCNIITQKLMFKHNKNHPMYSQKISGNLLQKFCYKAGQVTVSRMCTGRYITLEKLHSKSLSRSLKMHAAKVSSHPATLHSATTINQCYQDLQKRLAIFQRSAELQ